jgi:hypothetical protein
MSVPPCVLLRGHVVLGKGGVVPVAAERLRRRPPVVLVDVVDSFPQGADGT